MATFEEAIEQFADSLRRRISVVVDEALLEAFGAPARRVAKQTALGRPVPATPAHAVPRPAQKASQAVPALRRQRKPSSDSWVADTRQRGRVPNWVLEATGLADKKQIVAKYGDGAAFNKNAPVPPRHAGGTEAQPPRAAAAEAAGSDAGKVASLSEHAAKAVPEARAAVKARAPTVRKKK